MKSARSWGPQGRRSVAKQKAIRVIPDHIIQKIWDYVPGWLETIGETGAPSKDGEKNALDPRTRATSAKVGLDLFVKLLPTEDTSEAAKGLMADLQKLGTVAAKAARDDDSTSPAPVSTEESDQPSDTDAGDEGTDLEGLQK